MIDFSSQNGFQLETLKTIEQWLSNVAEEENYEVGELGYIFCTDDYLHGLNKTFLDHDTLTDVITFDYVVDKTIHGEIYISTERVQENSIDFDVSFMNELRRVMVHGLLHLCGYGDKTEEEAHLMREKEDYYLLNIESQEADSK